MDSYVYVPLTGIVPDEIPPGTKILVQVFLTPQKDRVISAQIAFRNDDWGTWGVPHELAEAP